MMDIQPTRNESKFGSVWPGGMFVITDKKRIKELHKNIKENRRLNDIIIKLAKKYSFEEMDFSLYPDPEKNAEDIKAWNNLKSNLIHPGNKLKLKDV